MPGWDSNVCPGSCSWAGHCDPPATLLPVALLSQQGRWPWSVNWCYPQLHEWLRLYVLIFEKAPLEERAIGLKSWPCLHDNCEGAFGRVLSDAAVALGLQSCVFPHKLDNFRNKSYLPLVRACQWRVELVRIAGWFNFPAVWNSSFPGRCDCGPVLASRAGCVLPADKCPLGSWAAGSGKTYTFARNYCLIGIWPILGGMNARSWWNMADQAKS